MSRFIKVIPGRNWF